MQFSAKTKNEAITKACIELGVSSDQLDIQVQENEEPSAEEKEAARKASTEYYNSNQEYRAGSIAAKANMVKQFDEKNSKKKK